MIKTEVFKKLEEGYTLINIIGEEEAIKFIQQNSEMKIPKLSTTVGVELEFVLLGRDRTKYEINGWKQKFDISVSVDDSIDTDLLRKKGITWSSIELVSPPMKEDISNTLYKMQSLLNEKTEDMFVLQQTTSGGMHIHRDISKWEKPEKIALFTVFKEVEDELLATISIYRLNNTYTRLIGSYKTYKAYDEANMLSKFLSLNMRTNYKTTEFRMFETFRNTKIIHYYCAIIDKICIFAEEHSTYISKNPSFVKGISLSDVVKNYRLLDFLNRRKEFLSSKIPKITGNLLPVRIGGGTTKHFKNAKKSDPEWDF